MKWCSAVRGSSSWSWESVRFAGRQVRRRLSKAAAVVITTLPAPPLCWHRFADKTADALRQAIYSGAAVGACYALLRTLYPQLEAAAP